VSGRVEKEYLIHILSFCSHHVCNDEEAQKSKDTHTKSKDINPTYLSDTVNTGGASVILSRKTQPKPERAPITKPTKHFPTKN